MEKGRVVARGDSCVGTMQVGRGVMQGKRGRPIGLLASLFWQLGWPNRPWFGSNFSLSLGLIRGKQNGLQEWTSINLAQKQKLQDNLKINKTTIMMKNYV